MMDDILTLNNKGVKNNNLTEIVQSLHQVDEEVEIKNPVINQLLSEGGEGFFHYLSSLGLIDVPNMMVLSPRHHYYDHHDFKGLTILINQKKLNLIKHLDSFLRIVSRALSPKASLIGCFYENRSTVKFEPDYPIYRRSVSLSGADAALEIDKIDVSELLESKGFMVMNMTEIKGLTYFRAQKIVFRKIA